MVGVHDRWYLFEVDGTIPCGSLWYLWPTSLGNWTMTISNLSGMFHYFFSSKPPFSGKGAYLGPELGVAKPGTAEASSERAGSIMERGERCPADLPFVQSPALRSFPWVG